MFWKEKCLIWGWIWYSFIHWILVVTGCLCCGNSSWWSWKLIECCIGKIKQQKKKIVASFSLVYIFFCIEDIESESYSRSTMTISSLIPPLPPLNFNNNNESKQQSTSRIPLSPKNSIHSNKIITTTTKTSNSNSNSNPNSIPSTSAAGVRFEGINGRTVESEQEEIEQEQQEEEEDVELTIENQSQVGVTGGGEDISMIVVDSDDESNSIRNTLDENLTPLHGKLSSKEVLFSSSFSSLTLLLFIDWYII